MYKLSHCTVALSVCFFGIIANRLRILHYRPPNLSKILAEYIGLLREVLINWNILQLITIYWSEFCEKSIRSLLEISSYHLKYRNITSLIRYFAVVKQKIFSLCSQILFIQQRLTILNMHLLAFKSFRFAKACWSISWTWNNAAHDNNQNMFDMRE